MEPITAIALGTGLFQGGLGIAKGAAGGAAREQDYLNQTAFQKANQEFAGWQATFNAKVNDLNSQYKYWADTINFNQEFAYSKSLQNVELIREIKQAELVRDTRAAAGSSYLLDSEAITAAYRENSMREAVALQQYQWRSLQARASVQAMNMEGNSVDRLVNQYHRQESDYRTISEINGRIRERQYTREQAGRIAQYLSQYNSQTFYDKAVVFDPIPPFAPLPTMIQPAGPSMIGGAPSRLATGLDMATGALSGVQAGLSMYSALGGTFGSSDSSGSTPDATPPVKP